MKREYLPLPDEVVELIEEYEANIDCRDTCVKSVFKAKRAVKYARDANRARRKFWQKVLKIYPDQSGVKLSYNWGKRAVYVSGT